MAENTTLTWLHGGVAHVVTVHPDHLLIAQSGGGVRIDLALPMIGRPHIPTGPGGVCLPDSSVRASGPLPADRTSGLVCALLAERLVLVPTGGGTVVAFDEVASTQLELADGGARFEVELRADLPERTLLDVCLRLDDGSHEVLAPHAVYHRDSWEDFGLIHVTDTHVARRIDSFRGILRKLGREGAAQRMVNWNDRFRGFVRFANQLHDEGHLDVLVGTGDLYDYIHEHDDDLAGPGNAGFLRELVLGRAPGPEFPDVEELRVPWFMAPGNHDYRKNPYDLLFDVNLLGLKDLGRARTYSGLHLLDDEAKALNKALTGHEVPNRNSDEAADMVAIDHGMRAWQLALAPLGPHVVPLGRHRVVLIDSAHDVGTVTEILDAIRVWWGSASEDEMTFVGGSPNCEGVGPAELAAATAALESAGDGLVLMALHAPLVNLWGNEQPYDMRETTRPSQPGVAESFLHRHGGPRERFDEGEIRRDHPTWFENGGAPTAYLTRGSAEDHLDEGVSRGHANELLARLAGVGGGRKGDVVLAGHTHRHNEIRIGALPDGSVAFYLDHYTQTPGHAYPSRVVTGAHTMPRGKTTTLVLETEPSYVVVDADASPGAASAKLPYDAFHQRVVRTPPYADPLDQSADPAAWWDEHRPLLLQTGALGPMESSQVSFSGVRLLTVSAGVIQRVAFISVERLEANGFRMPLDAACAVQPPGHRVIDVSGSHAAGRLSSLVSGAQASSVVHRDRDGRLVESWDVPGSRGSGILAGPDLAPGAADDPVSFVDPGGTAVVVYRAVDAEIHSVHWRAGAATGHDSLGAAAGAPQVQGRPAVWTVGGGSHAVYRTETGGLSELFWVDGPVSHAGLLDHVEGAPAAAGDPVAYGVAAAGQSIVVYRGEDAHIHTLYWADGPTGHDNLSGYVGSPPAVGDPVAYYWAAADTHQVAYRAADGHLHEIYWRGAEPAQVWDLTAAAGSPAAAADPACHFHHVTGLKHVVYVDARGCLHQLTWPPGGSMTWTDLSRAAMAPTARVEQPTVFSTPGSSTLLVAYRGYDDVVREIRIG